LADPSGCDLFKPISGTQLLGLIQRRIGYHFSRDTAVTMNSQEEVSEYRNDQW